MDKDKIIEAKENIMKQQRINSEQSRLELKKLDNLTAEEIANQISNINSIDILIMDANILNEKNNLEKLYKVKQILKRNQLIAFNESILNGTSEEFLKQIPYKDHLDMAYMLGTLATQENAYLPKEQIKAMQESLYSFVEKQAGLSQQSESSNRFHR